MDRLKQNLKRRKEKFAATDRFSKKSIIIGTLIATFIGMSPYLFYLYLNIPETQIWETYFFSYDSGDWGDARYAMWHLTNKIIPLLLILIWFFTCRHWWHHALLAPITMYVYQIIGIFIHNLKFIDKFELVYLIPVMAVIIPLIYLIRAKMFNKINDVDKTMEELEAEFMIKPTTIWGKLSQYF